MFTFLFCDKENHTWVGSWDNVLYRINNTNGEEEIFKTNSNNPYTFTNDEALDFAEDANNNIWIAGRHSGLHIYDKDEKRFYNYQHEASKEGTIAANTINCIFIDKKGKVRRIHTGFSGPATSDYLAYKAEFDKFVKELLAE